MVWLWLGEQTKTTQPTRRKLTSLASRALTTLALAAVLAARGNAQLNVVSRISIDEMAEIGSIVDMSFVGSKTLIAADPVHGLLWRIDLASESARAIGRRGQGPGEYRGPTNVCNLGDNRVAVWDPLTARVTQLNADGSFERQWLITASRSTPLFDCIDGRIIVARASDHPRNAPELRTGRLRSGGEFSVRRLSAHWALYRDSVLIKDSVFKTPVRDLALVPIGPEGQLGGLPVLRGFKTEVVALADGFAVIAPNGSLEIRDSEARLAQSLRVAESSDASSVSEIEWEAMLETVPAALRDRAREVAADVGPQREYFPVRGLIRCGPQCLLITVSTPGESSTAVEKIELHTGRRQRFRIADSVRLMAAFGDTVAGVSTNSEGEQHLVVYNLR